MLFAALQGAVDAGLKTNYEGTMTDEARISGAAMAQYAASLKSSDAAKYGRLFSAYLKAGFAPEKMVEAFKSAKAKIAGA